MGRGWVDDSGTFSLPEEGYPFSAVVKGLHESCSRQVIVWALERVRLEQLNPGSGDVQVGEEMSVRKHPAIQVALRNWTGGLSCFSACD